MLASDYASHSLDEDNELVELFLGDWLVQEVVHAGFKRSLLELDVCVGRAATDVGDLGLSDVLTLSVESLDFLRHDWTVHPGHAIVQEDELEESSGAL